VEIKCQLDATEVFIADLIACSTCSGTPLRPSSGAQEYYTVVAACGISCCKNVKNNFVSSTNFIFHKNLQIFFLHFYSTKYHKQQPLFNTLELLMMGIVMPETC